MRITLATPLGGHATGDTITVTPRTAELLIGNGDATATRDTDTQPKAPAKKNTRSTEPTAPEGGGDSPEESKSRRR